MASSYSAHIFFTSGSVIFSESITELPFAETADVEFVAGTDEPGDPDFPLHETATIATHRKRPNRISLAILGPSNTEVAA